MQKIAHRITISNPLNYFEIASINTHHQTKIEKQENDIAQLTAIRKSYTDTIENLNQRNRELTNRIEALEVENPTLTNKLEQHQKGLSTIFSAIFGDSLESSLLNYVL